jgi:hypothetical protein
VIPAEWTELRDQCDVPGCPNLARRHKRFCSGHEVAASRPSIVCQGCLTRLREPARLCIFCQVEAGELAAV